MCNDEDTHSPHQTPIDILLAGRVYQACQWESNSEKVEL